MILDCPLCLSGPCLDYFQDKKRHYLQCKNCDLVFVSPEYLPSQQAEKQEYDLHQNDEQDPGYRRFLQRTFTPLSQAIKPGAQGLDFGCGPTPLLADMLTKAGFPTQVYDPFYFPDQETLTKQYDFISCTEAIEHFHQPYQEWALWQSMLKPKGIIAIMTKRLIDKERFSHWHYKNDPTHVSFFSEKSFILLAKRSQMQVKFVDKDVVIFHS